MDADYFSIDAILAENQKIQCAFKEKLPDMGHLGGGKEPDINPGDKLQIPIWLSYLIIYSDWADFNIPQPFSARVRNALNAEAKSVRLSGLVGAGGLWYGFGKSIMDMLNDDQANEMSEVLTKTFRDRLLEVVDQAQHFAALGAVGGSAAGGGPQSTVAQTFREGLDATEREVFALAQESTKSTKRWYEEGPQSRR